MVDKAEIFKKIDGTVRKGGPVTRASYEAVWKDKGWRLSPPKKETE
jgi:hypothetical protein